MDSNDIRLGGISACIADDRRYTTVISVWLNTSTDEVIIKREESNPDGGMDAYLDVSWRLDSSIKIDRCEMSTKALAAQIVGGIKRLIDTEVGGTVKRYGAPTKNFTWTTHDDRTVKGLSVKNCLLALEGL